MKPPRTVLIVEDEEPVSDVLRYHLERAGHAALACYDGRAALAAARQHAPDLVLLDLGLPVVDGFEVCRAMAEDPALRDIPVVVYTGRGSRDDFDRCARLANVAGYFVKPYATADVVVHVGRVMAAGPGDP